MDLPCSPISPVLDGSSQLHWARVYERLLRSLQLASKGVAKKNLAAPFLLFWKNNANFLLIRNDKANIVTTADT